MFPSVAVLLLDLSEHPPRLPLPALDRGNPQLPRAVKTDIRTPGVCQIPRTRVTVPVHLDAVLGGNQRCGTQGEGRHTRSVEMNVTDSPTRSCRRRSQYSRSSGWRRYKASKSHAGVTASDHGACFRRSFHAVARCWGGSWLKRCTSRWSMKSRAISSQYVMGGRRSGGYAAPLVIFDVTETGPAVLHANVRRGRLLLRRRVCCKVDLLADTEVSALPPLCPRVLYVILSHCPLWGPRR
jgi:hypothetical protein